MKKSKSGQVFLVLLLLAAVIFAGCEGPAGPTGREGPRGPQGTSAVVPHIGENGNWWIGEVDTGWQARGPAGISGSDGVTPFISSDTWTWWIGGVDTGISATGTAGVPGNVPYIGANGNWWVEPTGDTGFPSTGGTGPTGPAGSAPYIGANGNWWVGTQDLGTAAQGLSGVSPNVGANGNWWIDGTDTNTRAVGYDGLTPTIGPNGNWFIGSVDTGIFAGGGTPFVPGVSSPKYHSLNPSLVLQNIDYNEYVGDVANPGRGFYGSIGTTATATTNIDSGTAGGSVPAMVRLGSASIGLSQFSSNSWTSNITATLWNSALAEADQVNEGIPRLQARMTGTTRPIPATNLTTLRNSLNTVVNNGGTTRSSQSYSGTSNWNDPMDMIRYDPEPYGYCQSGVEIINVLDLVPGMGGVIMVGKTTNVPLDPANICTNPAHTGAGPTGEGLLWFQCHISQIKEVVQDFPHVIAVVRGGTFGPWGEMHSSTYGVDPEAYHDLIEALLDAYPSNVPIQVHAGGYLGYVNKKLYGEAYGPTASEAGNDPTTGKNIGHPPNSNPAAFDYRDLGSPALIAAAATVPGASRIGMLNDSYANGLSHMNGLYSDMDSLSEGANVMGSKYHFDRSKILAWADGQHNYVGGETNEMSSYPYDSFPSVPWEAARLHTTHLNTGWYWGTYARWKLFTITEASMTSPIFYPHNQKVEYANYDPVYDGQNGLVFMRDRLGYRIVLRESYLPQVVPSSGSLEFRGKIQNVGFGRVVDTKAVYVVLRNEDTGDLYQADTLTDTSTWWPSRATEGLSLGARGGSGLGFNSPANTDAYRDIDFTVALSAFDAPVPDGNYEVYLRVVNPQEEPLTGISYKTMGATSRRTIRFANRTYNGAGQAGYDADFGGNLIGKTKITGGITYNIGDVGPAGGIIFYHDPAGFMLEGDTYNGELGEICYYLEVAQEDASLTPVTWASSTNDYQNNGDGGLQTYPAIGTGVLNAINILERTFAAYSGNLYHGPDPLAPAILLSRQYTGGGYADWFTPTQDELLRLRNFVQGEIGKSLPGPWTVPTTVSDMTGKKYWTSTDTINARPAFIDFGVAHDWDMLDFQQRGTSLKFVHDTLGGSTYYQRYYVPTAELGDHMHYVRPIRAF